MPMIVSNQKPEDETITSYWYFWAGTAALLLLMLVPMIYKLCKCTRKQRHLRKEAARQMVLTTLRSSTAQRKIQDRRRDLSSAEDPIEEAQTAPPEITFDVAVETEESENQPERYSFSASLDDSRRADHLERQKQMLQQQLHQIQAQLDEFRPAGENIHDEIEVDIQSDINSVESPPSYTSLYHINSFRKNRS